MLKYLSILIFSAIGSISNRIRGGGVINIKGNKLLNDLIFGISVLIFNWLITKDFNFRLAVFAGLAMGIGRSFAWGSYIGAIVSGEAKPRGDVQKIDDLFNWLLNQPRLWGVFTLGARGLLWTVPLGLAFNNLLIMPVGAAMGIVYWLAYITCNALKLKNAWELGEWYWGFVLWGSVAALCLY